MVTHRFYLYELRRNPQTIAQVLLVFLSLIVIFGTLSSPHPDLWERFLPLLLMGLSYAIISLNFDQLFREDGEDGTIEWIISELRPLEVYALSKVLIYWIRLGMPLAVISGLIAGSPELGLAVAIVTLTLTFLGAVGSALCLAIKSAAILLPLLILPLGIPILLVSMGAVTDFHETTPYLTLQLGLLCMASALSLLATPFALRIALK